MFPILVALLLCPTCTQMHAPVAGASGRGQSLSLAVGRGTAHVTVRTFKGDVRVRGP